jgi:pyruvate dehydrogenase E1 component
MGEGLQHDDGHSHVLASVVPNIRAYDPAYAYELAAIVREGIDRMFVRGAGDGTSPDVYYYITLYNENYSMPKRAADLTDEQIVRGIYRLLTAPDLGKDARGATETLARGRAASKPGAKSDALPVRLVGSGSILQQVVAARQLLAERGIAAEVYSATSFQQLRADGLAVDRWNRLHPEADPRMPLIAEVLPDGGPVVIATDWIRAYPDLVAPWLPANRLVLGTDGFGRSDAREPLRRLFEIDPPHIAAAAMVGLARMGRLSGREVAVAMRDLGVDPDAPDPRSL